MAMRPAAEAMAWMPDEQNRLTVMAGTSLGTPARKLATRATFMPWSPSGKAQPAMTSPSTAGSSPSALLMASLMARPRSVSGRVSRKPPLRALATGVRAMETTAISRI